jgi:hypothetical protein
MTGKLGVSKRLARAARSNYRVLQGLVALGSLFAADLAIGQGIPLDEPSFTKHIAQRLRSEVNGMQVTIKGPLTLSVGAMQANLDRVYMFCRRNSEGCATEINTYVRAAAQLHRQSGISPTKKAVRVVVRSVRYVQQAQAQLPAGSPRPQTTPFVDGFVVVPMLDSPRALRILTEKDSAALGLTASEIHELGITNLRKTLKPIAEIAKPVAGGQIGQLTGDVFNPSRLILIDAWEPLALKQGGILITAAPTTSSVFYISDDAPTAIAAFRALVRKTMASASNPLTDVVLRWTPNGWRVVP